jgi:hypothetical protein
VSIIRILTLRRYGYDITYKLPMVPVDIALRVEGLFTDVAHVSVGELFLGFGLDAGNILYIGGYHE